MSKIIPTQYETLGQLPMQDAVVSTAIQNGKSRLIATVLTDGLSAHKRKEKLAQARAEITNNIIGLSGKQTRLSKQFADAGAMQIKASIKSPLDAGLGIKYMLEETDQPIIILDCQDKASFWTALKSQRVDDDTLFALAELEALKPEDTKTKQVKSVGTAHELCEAISKTGEEDKKQLIDFIIKSKKFKIPEFNLFEHAMTARFKHGATPSKITTTTLFIGHQIVGRTIIAAGKLTKLFGWKTLPSTKRDFILAVHKGALRRNLKRNPETSVSHYKTIIDATEKMTDEQVDIAFGTPPHKVEIPEDKQKYLENESVYELSSWGVFNLNIRDGYHFLKEDKSFFEFEYVLGNNESATVYALAHQVGGEIRLRFFLMQDDQLSKVTNSGVIELDENMQMTGWYEIENKTGKVIRNNNINTLLRQGEQNPHLVPGLTAHIANICARMNEVDYAGHIIEPTGGKMRQGKHKFPYFAYEVAEDPLKPTLIRVVSSDRRVGPQLRESPIFHKVSRHTRTLNRGTPDEHVMIIGPHTRGDASKGLQRKGTQVTLAQP